MENFKKITKQQSPARTIAFGFAVLIFIGAALLSLPIAVRGAGQLPGLDALFTATSAVCVTGLVTVDPGDTFTLFGQAVLAVLMQLGGLGISSVSMGLAIAAGRRSKENTSHPWMSRSSPSRDAKVISRSAAVSGLTLQYATK